MKHAGKVKLYDQDNRSVGDVHVESYVMPGLFVCDDVDLLEEMAENLQENVQEFVNSSNKDVMSLLSLEHDMRSFNQIKWDSIPGSGECKQSIARSLAVMMTEAVKNNNPGQFSFDAKVFGMDSDDDYFKYSSDKKYEQIMKGRADAVAVRVREFAYVAGTSSGLMKQQVDLMYNDLNQRTDAYRDNSTSSMRQVNRFNDRSRAVDVSKQVTDAMLGHNRSPEFEGP